MKRIIFLTCLGTIVLSLPAWSAPNKPASKSARRPSAHAVSMRGAGHAMRNASMRTARTYPAARIDANTNARIHARTDVVMNHSRTLNRTDAARNNRMAAERNRNARITSNARVNPTMRRDLNANGAIATPTPLFAIIIGNGMPVVGGEVTIRGSFWSAADGGTGTTVTGFQPGDTTRIIPTTRMTAQSTAMVT
jgi:hypothetical protein